MGREVRRVPPNWQHPQEEKVDMRRQRLEMRYKPMRDRSAESDWEAWQKDFAAWLAGEHDRIIAEYGATDYPKAEPYRAFCKWHGQPPGPDYYLPAWDESTATWWQVYETVSEGTPVTPPFATPEELIDYLVANGDFWDQSRRAEGNSTMSCGPWEREAAEKFVKRGWAPSMMLRMDAEGRTTAAQRVVLEDLLAAAFPVIREAEQRADFRDGTYDPEAHVELTLTIAELLALDAAIDKALEST